MLPVRLSAVAMLIAGCAPSQASRSSPAPDRCGLVSWLARNVDSFPVPLVPEDSLDSRPRVTNSRAGPISRPAGFVPGFEADVLLAVVIDTLGRVAYAESVGADIRRTRAQGLDPRDLRERFDRSAIDLITPNRYTVPMYHGARVMALVCMPITFREGL